MSNPTTPLPIDDYTQSANVLFHFMKEERFLEDILTTRKIFPRYCMENVEYLGLTAEGINYNEILVLEKCFCDIPFHKLTQPFELEIIEDDDLNNLSDEEIKDLTRRNTHPDCYGQYGIAFSKRWAEEKNLEPVQYINEDSEISNNISRLFSELWNMETLPEMYGDDFLRRISLMKPLRGIMTREYERKKTKKKIKVKIRKNFHDEQEWRYIPSTETVKQVSLLPVIANTHMLELNNRMNILNNNLASEKYKGLCLTYNYDDIRYLIVPDVNARIMLIEFIRKLPDAQFLDSTNIETEKSVLISKILVLDEIRKDW